MLCPVVRIVVLTVDHVGSGGKSVGNDTGRASRVDIGAVLLGDTRGGAAALGGDLGKDASDGGTGSRGGGLEVLNHLGSGASGGGGGSSSSEGAAVGEGSGGSGALGTGAVGLDDGTLDVLAEVAADLGGGGAVNLDAQDV